MPKNILEENCANYATFTELPEGRTEIELNFSIEAAKKLLPVFEEFHEIAFMQATRTDLPGGRLLVVVMMPDEEAMIFRAALRYGIEQSGQPIPSLN